MDSMKSAAGLRFSALARCYAASICSMANGTASAVEVTCKNNQQNTRNMRVLLAVRETKSRSLLERCGVAGCVFCALNLNRQIHFSINCASG